MLEQFIGQLLETIEGKGGSVSSVVVNYDEDGERRLAAFSALEIEKNVRRNGWQLLIDSRLIEKQSMKINGWQGR
jgi:hypothetical protein